MEERGTRNKESGRCPLILVPCSMFLALLLIVACSSPQPTPTPNPTLSPTVSGGLTVQVISTDLSLGPNRLAFAVLQDGSTVDLSEVAVASVFPVEGSSGTVRHTGSARFRKWPFGDIGVYTTQMDFDQAGTWGLIVNVPQSGGAVGSALASLSVKGQSETAALGSQAPLSKNKTARDVNSLEELSELKDRYEGRANFIHVEIFDNPHEIQGDLSAAKTVPAAEEWGLPTEPWTFIVDQQGRVASKFEAFTTVAEIEEALAEVLN